MLRLANVFFIIQSLYVVVDFHASNAFVTSAPPPPIKSGHNITKLIDHLIMIRSLDGDKMSSIVLQ